MAANSNHQERYQLAIINPEIQDNYLVSEDTVTIHPFTIGFSTYHNKSCNIHFLNSASLIDDPTIKCKLELFFSEYNKSSAVDIVFKRGVPPAYEYQVSLYYVNKAAKLVHVSSLDVKNVRENYKFSIPCSSAFHNNVSLLYETSRSCCVDYNYAFCIKFTRKDVLANINKKPALLMPTQITDCSLLFGNTALTNYTIIVEDREFQVHKDILAAKSPVFLTMFETEMKEKKENKVTIDDIEAEIFQEFLRYIYTNIVNDLNLHAENLLMLAEKYDVPKLKSICIDEISRSLAVENAPRILLMADSYGIKCLKDRAMGFIRNNIKVIINTEEYKALYRSEKFYLIHEIFQMLV